MADLFGPPPCPASHSPHADRAEVSTTSATCGLSSTTSCAPADPNSFLVSRSPLPQSSALQARLESAVRRRTAPLGSTLFSLTWKPHVTPAGRSLSRLVASARPTSDKGSIGALLTNWPTAKASDGSGGRTTETAGGGNAHLDREVRLASWPTTGRDWKDGEECLNVPRNALLGREVWLAGWGTPMSGTPLSTHCYGKDQAIQLKLAGHALLSSWPTPMAGTAAQKGYNEAGNNDSSRKTVSLASWTTEDGPARLTVFGEMLTGSSARMASGGQLNPEHSRWLQGFLAAWENCAPTETRSALNKRKSLSKPFLKASDLFSGWEDIL